MAKIIKINPDEQRLQKGDRKLNITPRVTSPVNKHDIRRTSIHGVFISKDKLVNSNGEIYPIKKKVKQYSPKKPKKVVKKRTLAELRQILVERK